MFKICQTPNTVKRILNEFESIFKDQRSLLIVLHDNPDPDAIASGFALQYLCESLYDLKVTLAYGGLLTRAENRTMARLLNISLHKMNTIRFNKFDRIAMVDTQPGRGNNSLPDNVFCHVVFDHHPLQTSTRAGLVVYNKTIGATATLLHELILASELPVRVDLATAITYAIRTETQELNREASDRDVRAYLSVYPISSLKKLGRITYPKLRPDYYKGLSDALQNAKIYRYIIIAHLDFVETPEIIAEIADILLRLQRISWVLVTGFYKKSLYLSLRTSQTKIQAHRIIEKIVDNKKFAGGHVTFAGGRIDLNSLSREHKQAVLDKTFTRFTAALGFRDVEWRELLEKEGEQL